MFKKDLNFFKNEFSEYLKESLFRANCIKLKSMIREKLKLFKNIKNNLYGVKKDCGSIQIDLKKLKEEFF